MSLVHSTARKRSDVPASAPASGRGRRSSSGGSPFRSKSATNSPFSSPQNSPRETSSGGGPCRDCAQLREEIARLRAQLDALLRKQSVLRSQKDMLDTKLSSRDEDLSRQRELGENTKAELVR